MSRWPICAVVLAGGLFRFLTLGVQSYWYNEADTVFLVKHGFGSMLKLIPKLEGNPPLYYILAWVWSHIFGTGEVALRSLSALGGTALIAVVYVLAKHMAGARAGLIAALLTATNPLLFWFSQEARPYIFLVLVVALGFLFFLKALEDPSPRTLSAWAVVSIISLTTHYFTLFAVVPELAWLLLRLRSRRQVALAGTAVAAAGALLLPLAIRQREAGAATSIVGSFPRRMAELPKQLLVGYSGPAEKLVSAVAAALAVYSLYLLVKRGDEVTRRGALIAAVIGVGSLVIVLVLAAVGLDYINTRNMIGLALFAILVMALGFSAPRAGSRGILAAVCLSVVLLVDIIGVERNPIYQRDDWRGAVRALGPATSERAVVVTPGQGYYPILYYLPRAKFMSGQPAAVSEVDLLGIAIRHGSGVAPAPPPVPPASPFAGFREVAAIKNRMFTVVRYRSVAPLAESPTALRAQALSPGSRLVFLDTPAAQN